MSIMSLDSISISRPINKLLTKSSSNRKSFGLEKQSKSVVILDFSITYTLST